MKHTVKWHDSGYEPKEKPNPNYPIGKDVDASGGAEVTCLVELPYPAKRIGHYKILCQECGSRTACTTAGRPDDPKSIRIACLNRGVYGVGGSSNERKTATGSYSAS